jgi:hypothetical protein
MIELSVLHDGRFWIARSESISLKAESLDELDRAVASVVRANAGPGACGCRQVRMFFDHSVIPQWIRQYSNHYFNRVVRVDLGLGEPEETSCQ